MRRTLVLALCLATVSTAKIAGSRAAGLDPRGTIHIPIGIPDTVDTLKTFVEPEGNFSPGCGSYGLYFWVFDHAAGKLIAPTMKDVNCEHGLTPEGYLIPWSAWRAGELTVKTSVCEVQRSSPAGQIFVVGAKAILSNPSAIERHVSLYVALRPLGPAGYAVKQIDVAPGWDALLVEGHPALVCHKTPDAIGVVETDTVGDAARKGELPAALSAKSAAGDCSGAARYDLAIGAGQTRDLEFVCPVLPGRRAARHQWDGTSKWAQLDLNRPNPPSEGLLQPDPGLDYYRAIQGDVLFGEARAYWTVSAGRTKLDLPDARWPQALTAILSHVAIAMNEGAPDVTVVNYNVFNRNGVYVANILQKSGRFDLAERAIDYFLSHPFNGRVQVEADNPGQILWVTGQHWLISRDRRWLQRVYPSVAKIGAMVRYYRTTPLPHYVKATSLEVGDALPPDQPGDAPAYKRQVLQDGACDGFNPSYTEAFDVAGLRAGALMARALDKTEEAQAWEQLAASLMAKYDRRFGDALPAGYGSYSVLWPCRLYPLQEGKGFEQFKNFGAQEPAAWRYFPLAKAHQGLLCGHREAGYGTLEKHLEHEQMKGWYAFDEGGHSGEGGWKYYRTRWTPGVAMPHGWAIAELWLLLRDCLAFEDGSQLVVLGGVPPGWFQRNMAIENMPTAFGSLGLRYRSQGSQATLKLTGQAAPPQGFVLRLPREIKAGVRVGNEVLRRRANGDFLVPAQAAEVRLKFLP